MPFPHISASLPSALKIRIFTSAEVELDNSRRPSAPTEKPLLHRVRANSVAFMSLILLSRLSTTIKSLPRPCIFQNCTLVTQPFVDLPSNRQAALVLSPQLTGLSPQDLLRRVVSRCTANSLRTRKLQRLEPQISR